MKTKTISTRSLVIMAMFAAVLCVSAYISIPLPNGSHITALNFIVTVIALVFPLEQSALIVIIWALLGLVGVPVFIGGNAGAGYLFGPLGGFSFAFILIAILVPLVRGQKYNRIMYTIVAIASAVLVDLVGSLWLMVAANMTLKAALLAGFAPFIVLDIVKAVIAAQIAPQFKKIFIGE
ncbi:MAG: biotin transporter BioY [Lachnospiraceae bacterium]|nr:biotin transporter BioY [Lachnospiraceae bacterium]